MYYGKSRCNTFVCNRIFATKEEAEGKNDKDKIGSSGNFAQIDSTGEDSVICCAGSNSIVKAKKGSWITLSEWRYSKEKGRNVPVRVKTEYVDGEKIKEDTWYKLDKGNFVEVL